MPPMAQNAMLELGGVLTLQLNNLMQQPTAGWFEYQYLTLFSALLIHASWLHLLGNMVYLWVFGIPLERRIGGAGYRGPARSVL